MYKLSEAELNEFHKSYMTTALWSSADESDDTPEESHIHECCQFSDQTEEDMLEQCKEFLTLANDLIQEEGKSFELAGHDFWLTRCGHGAGFWDGDWPVNGDKLSAICETLGNVDLYVGDDGLVYI